MVIHSEPRWLEILSDQIEPVALARGEILEWKFQNERGFVSLIYEYELDGAIYSLRRHRNKEVVRVFSVLKELPDEVAETWRIWAMVLEVNKKRASVKITLDVLRMKQNGVTYMKRLTLGEIDRNGKSQD